MGEIVAHHGPGEEPPVVRGVLATELLPPAERILSEADNINRNRLPDGSHAPWVLNEMLPNYVAATEEGGMPSAVSEVFHKFVKGFEDGEGNKCDTFVWLGRTSLQSARSGRIYYVYPESQERGYVEEDEAAHSEQDRRPGIVSFFVSAHMSPTDALKEVAEAENLAEQDALRASWVEVDADGTVKGRRLQSVLIKDIPLEAWVEWLADPNNPFGKSVEVEDPSSALSVMKTFRALKVPWEALPDPDQPLLGVLKTIIPYIKDQAARQEVKTQLVDFYSDQASKRERAHNIARRWRDFDVALADSLHSGVAEPSIEAFVYQLSDRWTAKDLSLISSSQIKGTQKLKMFRELAVLIEEAQRKLFFDAASVVSDNREVLKQLDPKTAAVIRANELRVQTLYTQGRHDEIVRLQATNNQIIAGLNLSNGGGCPGKSKMRFAGDDIPDLLRSLVEQQEPAEKPSSSMDQKTWKRKKGKCVVRGCPTRARPEPVEVGPCGVCMDRCQEIYNEGGDPTTGITNKVVIKSSEKPKPEGQPLLDILQWQAWMGVGTLATDKVLTKT
jgi:hypothetical protein